MSHSTYSIPSPIAYNGSMANTQTQPDPRIEEISLPDVRAWRWENDYTKDFGYVSKGELLWDPHNHTFTYCTRVVRPTDPGTWTMIRCRGDMWEGRDTVAKARETAQDFIFGIV